MTNSKREYNEFIRANLPYGITYDSARYQYVTFNGKRFVTYLEAKWYIDYLTKFGGGPEDDIRNDLFGASEEGVWFEANDATTLFTDVAGTTPVTTPGDAVALQLDKSQGLTLGPELVTNGDFSDGLTGWTTAGWSVIDGRAVGNSGQAALQPSPAIAIEAGKTYQVSFTIISSPFLAVALGGVTLGSIWASGTYTRLVKAVTTANLSFAAGGGSESTIDNISVKELPGNHRTQATTAARPLYALHPVGGVRNLLEYTEDYSEWLSNAVGGEEFDAIAPDGTSTALKVTFGAAANEIFAPPVTSITGQTVLGFFAKADSARPLNISATVGGVATTAYFGSANLTSNWQFFEFPKDSGADEITQIRFQNTGTTEERTVPVYVWHPQVEQSSTATNYQRVGSFLDVSEEGKARRGRLWYNGTSHFMQTPTITPGTDKVQVFAGVRKLSDAAQAALASFGNNTEDGSVETFAPRGTTTSFRFGTRSGGTVKTPAADASGSEFDAPITVVFTSLCSISEDLITLRIDGTQVAQNTADQGSGNYLAYPIYFGARAGTSLFFNGYEDTSIVRFGPNLDDTTISKVESYVASKTPASELLIPAGPELVTNGTFDTDVSGWDADANGTISWDNGTLKYTGTGAGPTFMDASQTLSTIVGQRYRVSFELTALSPTNPIRCVVTGTSDVITVNDSGVAVGDFIATNTSTLFQIGIVGGVLGETFNIDNVSVRQFIPK